MIITRCQIEGKRNTVIVDDEALIGHHDQASAHAQEATDLQHSKAELFLILVRNDVI